MKIQKYIKSKKELGENLKKARIKLGISQDIVAKLTNLSRSSISYYESRVNLPNIFILIKLMQIYKITINDLIFTRNTKNWSIHAEQLFNNFIFYSMNSIVILTNWKPEEVIVNAVFFKCSDNQKFFYRGS